MTHKLTTDQRRLVERIKNSIPYVYNDVTYESAMKFLNQVITIGYYTDSDRKSLNMYRARYIFGTTNIE